MNDVQFDQLMAVLNKIEQRLCALEMGKKNEPENAQATQYNPNKATRRKKHKPPQHDAKQYARDFIFNTWGAKALEMSGL